MGIDIDLIKEINPLRDMEEDLGEISRITIFENKMASLNYITSVQILGI